MRALLPQFILLPIFLFLTVTLAGQYSLPMDPVETPVPLAGFAHPASVIQVRLDHQALAAQANDVFTLSLGTTYGELSFTLHRQDLRSDNFRRTFASGRVDNSYRKSAQFIGTLQDEPEGVAYFTFDEHFLMGHWKERGVNWVLEPRWMTDPAAPRDLYLLFQEDNLIPSGKQCTVTSDLATSAGAGRSGGWIGAREIDLAVAVDSLMFRQFPSAASVENFMLGLLALVQGDYDRGFDEKLCFRLSDLYLSDGVNPEPWSGIERAESLLSLFQAWGNEGSWASDFDMATLWTGRDLWAALSGNSNIGYAYIDGTCSVRRYHIVEYWSTGTSSLRAIWSHEIGHNLGASHVTGANLIMNPTLGPNNRVFSATARFAIQESLIDYNCLTTSPWLVFTATGIGQVATLDWSYRWRLANEGFTVERALSPNGPFSAIGWVEATESPEQRVYQYLDEDLEPGSVLYYRLRQVDANGTEFVTPQRKVVITYPNNLRISPNPAVDAIRIVSSSESSTNYRITDIIGRVVRSGEVALGGTDVNLSGLDAGVYLYYEVDGEQVNFVTKLVKL